MEKQSKNANTNRLQTVIIFNNIFGLKSKTLNIRRTEADNYIYMTSPSAYISPDHDIIFDQILKVDYEKENLIKELKKLVKDPELTRFIPLCDDVNILVAELREIFKVPGPCKKEMLKFVNKFETKKVLEENGIRVPVYLVPNEEDLKDIDKLILKAEKVIGYPIFGKPGEGCASQNTYRITNRAELKEAINFYTSKKMEFELDEFLTGKLLETDCLIVDKKIEFFVCSENMRGFAEFLKKKNVGQIMYKADQEIYQRLLKYTEKFVKATNTPDNTLDIEVWLTPKDQLVIQECQLRRPGNSVPDIIQMIYGFNIEMACFEVQCGTSVRVPKDDFKTPYRRFGAWVEFPTHVGKVIVGLNDLPLGLKSKVLVDLKYNVGMTVPVVQSTYDASGNVIFTHGDWDELYCDWMKFLDWHPYVYEA